MARQPRAERPPARLAPVKSHLSSLEAPSPPSRSPGGRPSIAGGKMHLPRRGKLQRESPEKAQHESISPSDAIWEGLYSTLRVL